MTEGYILLHRGLLKHWLWKDRVFSKAEAWIDILFLVNFAESTHKIGNEVLTVHPGSRYVTIRELCKRWKWSNTKVSNFLGLLENEKMIAQNHDKKKTLITVVNWEKYQVWNDKKTSEKRQKNVKKTSLNKERKERNKENIYIVILQHWNSQKIIVHRDLTEDIEKAIKKALKDTSPEELKTAIERYAKIIHDEDYYYSHKWTLINFLNRQKGYKEFLDDGEKWINYLQRNSKNDNNDIESSVPFFRE